jgi:pimeloyl-ACP methyl ester carboxylesterase
MKLRRREFVLASGAVTISSAALAAGSDIGVVLMHGKWGTPEKGIAPVEQELRGAGIAVTSKEMPWSDRRAYDATWDEAMAQIDGEVAALRAAGARRIVVGGQSMGANVALGYGARRPDIAGVMALAPGHLPERAAHQRDIAESLEKARRLMGGSSANQYANFSDFNQGRSREVSAKPAVYLSYFDPQGPAVMPVNAAALSPRVALLWVVGTKDPLYGEGRSYAFDRAPANPHSRFATVDADHFETPLAARRIALEWLNGL